MMEALTDNLQATGERFNPFPGLRPFEPDEDHLFFGRERETDELLRRLRTNRFVSVLGTSGSGKSSLVRSGLIPSLYSGFMVKAGSAWRVAIFRPGEDPIGNLAEALNDPEVLGGDESLADTNRMLLETTLRRSTLGLADCARHAHLSEHENLLVVVDQFEELFRFRESRREHGTRDEAVAFAKLLLDAANQDKVPVYVVVTMRSDFIGDCMEYPGLPEAINRGQYLIPRMTREEMRAAITGPVKVGGGEIASRLVARLLNEVGDDPDQLPVLQHALMRSWDRWSEDQTDDEPLDLRHYEDVGTMSGALSRHAEEAYAELTGAQDREIAERLFKALTDKRMDDRGVRRPTPVHDVARAAGVSDDAVIRVVEAFRRPGRSFLMPPSTVELAGDSILDLSHESLMRNWERLVEWVDEETTSGKSYRRICRSARRYEQGEGSLWVDPELSLGLKWREENKPTEVWAQRYDPSFTNAMRFLDESRDARDRALRAEEEARLAKLRRARILSAVLGSAAVVTLAFGLFAVRAGRIAKRAEQVATQEAETSRAVTDFVVSLFEVADPEEARGDTITAREILDEGARKIDAELSDQPGVQARMMQTVGKVYGSLGLYGEARPLLERSVATAEQVHGSLHEDTLSAKYQLAGIHWNEGHYPEAEALYDEALQGRTELLGEDDPATLETLTGLAQVYEDLGRFQEAEETARRAMEAQKRVLGEEDPATLRSMHRVGSALFELGRQSEAEEILVQAWEAQKRTLGAEAPDTIATMEDLGKVYTELARYDEAEALYTASLETRRSVYGDDHPKTLVAQYRLGYLNQERGQWNLAESQLREVLDTRRRVLGPEHPSTLQSEAGLAWLLRLQDRLEEAEGLAEHAYEAGLGVLGEEHDDARGHANVLAAVYLNQGRYAKCETLLAENLEIYDRLYGPAHPSTTTARNNLAVLYDNWGRNDKAFEMYERNVEIQRETLGEEHPSTLFSMNNYIVQVRDQGRLEEAEKLAVQNLERHRRVLGNDNPQTFTAMVQLGMSLGAQKKFEEVDVLVDEYIAGHRRLFGDDHPSTLGALMGMSGYYMGQNRNEEALVMRQEVLQARRKIFGEEHTATISGYDNVAWALQVTGDPAGALEHRQRAMEIRKSMADRENAGPQDKHRYAAARTFAQRDLQAPQDAVRYALEACEMTEFKNRNYVNTLSEAYFRAGRTDKAIEFKEKALALTTEDNIGARNDYESRLAQFHEAAGNLEPKRRMQIAELEREREKAEKPGAAPRDKRAYARELLYASPVDLRDPQKALRIALEVNEETGYDDTGLLVLLAMAYYHTGQADKAIETQEKVLAKVGKDEVWPRNQNENRMLVYRGGHRKIDLTSTLPGTWSGSVGPLSIKIEFVRDGDYINGIHRTELPWLPANEIWARFHVGKRELEIHSSDQGWTNLRWEPGEWLVTPNGDLLAWHYEDFRVLRLRRKE